MRHTRDVVLFIVFLLLILIFQQVRETASGKFKMSNRYAKSLWETEKCDGKSETMMGNRDAERETEFQVKHMSSGDGKVMYVTITDRLF